MKAIVLDTETTGLTNPEVIELATLPMDNSFTAIAGNAEVSLFKPNKDIETGAYKVHGISMKDVQNKPNCQALLTESNHLDKAEYIIGHHIAYDIGAITNSIGAGKKEFKTICTKRLAFELLGLQPSYSLVNLVKKYAPETAAEWSPRAHSALADVMMTSALLRVLVAKLQEQTGSVIGIDELYVFSSSLAPMAYEDYKRV